MGVERLLIVQNSYDPIRVDKIVPDDPVSRILSVQAPEKPLGSPGITLLLKQFTFVDQEILVIRMR
jgi:hypothetical protein